MAAFSGVVTADKGASAASILRDLYRHDLVKVEVSNVSIRSKADVKGDALRWPVSMDSRAILESKSI